MQLHQLATVTLGAALVAAVLLGGGAALADPPGRDRHEIRRDHRPPHGAVVRNLPRDHRVIRHRDLRFYFSGGTWYRPLGSRFVVVAPPIGAVVPILPLGYMALTIGGRPYYRYDDAYYVRHDRGFMVIEPPDQADDPVAFAPPQELFVYPRAGQSEKKQATDRFECHEWASDRTGYDPTQAFGGVEPAQSAPRRADYLRAMTACLEARGYTVR